MTLTSGECPSHIEAYRLDSAQVSQQLECFISVGTASTLPLPGRLSTARWCHGFSTSAI